MFIVFRKELNDLIWYYKETLDSLHSLWIISLSFFFFQEQQLAHHTEKIDTIEKDLASHLEYRPNPSTKHYQVSGYNNMVAGTVFMEKETCNALGNGTTYIRSILEANMTSNVKF